VVPGLVGGESDTVYVSSSPQDVTILAASRVSCQSCNGVHSYLADATMYHDKSGAWVFDAATFYWGWGLDGTSIDPASPVQAQVTPAFQRFTANILDTLMNGQSSLSDCVGQAVHQL
jgi:hypothetical protein